MSEMNNPDASNLNEEDPLEELARIVSGADESVAPAPAPVAQVQNAPETVESGNDLESQLMRELGVPGLDGLDAGTKTANIPSPEPANDVAPARDSEFHDELLAVLDAELHPSTVPPAQAAVQAPAPLPPEENPAVAPNVSAGLGDFKDEFVQMLEDSAGVQTDPADQVIAAAGDVLQETPAPAPGLANGGFSGDVEFEAEFGASLAEELGTEFPASDQTSPAHSTFEAGSEAASAAPPLNSPDPAMGTGDPGHADDISLLNANSDPHPTGMIPVGGGSKRYAIIALALALVIGLAAAGYGFFGSDTVSNGETPIIQADKGPLKVKPADPGGRQVANQDKASYKEVEGSQNDGQSQTSLISNTEEPADLSTGNPVTPAPKSDDRLLADNGEPEAPAIGGVSPRKVKTVTVKPDGTILLSEPETVAAAAQINAGSDSVAVETAGNTGTAAVQPIDGATASGTIGVPSTSPLPKPVKTPAKPVVVKPALPKPVEVASTGSSAATSQGTSASAWVVQVSSQRSPEAAQASFQNLQRRFASVFNGREAGIQRAIIKDKGTFYRVRVKTASKSDASQFCTQFKAAGGSCFVTR